MRARRGPIRLASILLVGLVALSWAPSTGVRGQGEPHPPILIEGDEGFTAAQGVRQGNGTVSNPYVIEGWAIFASEASGVVLRNTTAHAVIRGLEISGGGWRHDAIVLEGVRNVLVERSFVYDNWNGVRVDSSADVTIRNSFAAANGFGIFSVESERVQIFGNELSFNHWTGILVWVSQDATVTSNLLVGNRDGITFSSSSRARVDLNSVVASSGFGIYVFESDGILLYRNSIISNRVQAYDDGGVLNSWNADYLIGGNFWSDYSGADGCSGPDQNVCTSGDGIGDTPYPIDANSFDRYPVLRGPAALDPRPVAAFTVTPPGGVVTTTFIVDATASLSREVANQSLEVRWDWEDDGIWDTEWSTVRTSEVLFPGSGDYVVRLEVRDAIGRTNTTTRFVPVRAVFEGVEVLGAMLALGASVPVVILFLAHRQRRRSVVSRERGAAQAPPSPGPERPDR
jgi:parallel beta-helix repeat protein